MQPLLLTLVVGLFIVGGIAIGTASKNNKKFVDFAIGSALGVIVMLIVLELLPEAYEHLEMTSKIKTFLLIAIVVAIGFLLIHILDNLVPHHHHVTDHDHEEECQSEPLLGHIGILASAALIMHNVIEGMTLYVTVEMSLSAGYLLCAGIGLHNIPVGIVIAGTLHNKKQLILSSFLLVISSFVGGLLMYFIPHTNEFMVGIFITLTVGMLVYIVVMELLGQVIHSNNKRMSVLGIITGVGILIVSLFLG